MSNQTSLQAKLLAKEHSFQFNWQYLNDLQDAEEHWGLLEDYYVYEFYYWNIK